MSRTLAIDIGGTRFRMAVFDHDRITAREARSTDREGGREWMMGQIAEIGRRWRTAPGYERCGIGFGGPVLFREQRVALSTHVGGWSNAALSREITEMLGVPCVMDNDANVGALGEALLGAGAGFDPLLYLTISTGIGGGIILGGRIYRGADSFAGELGHVVIRPDGPRCLCGANGCLERMCSGLWLERDYGRPAKELLQDDAFVARYVADLAAGLKTAIMVLNPARIVIGGGISRAGERLFDPLRTELRRQVTSWSRARIDVVPAQLGDDSVLFGALELARELDAAQG
jgi:glucokinase